MEKLLFSLVIILNHLFPNSHPGDATASEILTSFEKKLEKIDDISGTMVYSISRYGNLAETQKGSFLLKKGNKFCVFMAGQKIVCNGETQWVHVKEADQSFQNDYDPKTNFNLEGLFGLFKYGENLQYKGTEKVNGMCHKVLMDINSEEVNYNKAIYWINVQTQVVERIVTIDETQIMTSYQFADLKINQGLEDWIFSYDNSVKQVD